MSAKFDIVVIGGGHAGIEAALAAARLGQNVLLATNNLSRIGFMSCNPSIGGLGKGHMVKEIDVLGGEMGVAADRTCIQFRRLNASKGPAVRGSRVQCDKDLYVAYMTEKVFQTKGLTVREAEVQSLLLSGDMCVGVLTNKGEKIFARSVIITTGTFMNAVMHFGLKQIPGGRVGDQATIGISDQLAEFGFTVGRLKTGTPARAERDSIDWSRLERQPGDEKFIPFSFRSPKSLSLPQIDCFMTWTNERTHEVIRKNLHLSPMFCGVIKGIGPRYCPSIEDKIHRFADKDRHQSFLEPEGLNTSSIYIQGMSTSLPEEVQYEFLRTMPGLENVRLIRPGYAVEYDFVAPTQLHPTLETRRIANLYLAGQVNGTSGYEEAASQGLMAGINSALKNLEKDPFVLRRDEAYIGVLIDDLITKGTKEPYRMMTSRAEHRLVLREDNNLERLAHHAISLGLVSEETRRLYEEILEGRSSLRKKLDSTKLVPTAETQEKLSRLGTAVLQKPISCADLLRRSEIRCLDLNRFGIEVPEDENIWEPVEIDVKYEGYIKRQKELIAQTIRLEMMKVPADLNYSEVYGLSREEVEKLSEVRPLSVGQAQRISGVNPSAIQALLVHLKGREARRNENRPWLN